MAEKHLSHISEEIEPVREPITALPRWDSPENPRRTRSHRRYGSQDPVLIKDIFSKEAFSPATRSGATTPENQENPRHSRMILWLVACIISLLVLAIILGAVLGTLINPNGHSSQASVTNIPAGSSPTTLSNAPTMTTPLESLAVTGWSVDGQAGYFMIWLFWQDSDGYLSRMSFDSSTGNWTRVAQFASGKRGTPLAAASLDASYYVNQPNYSFPEIIYQAEVLYLDKSNYVSQHTFPDSGPIRGLPGSLNEQKYMAFDTSGLAYYWPRIVYQGVGGELRGAHFECFMKNECWNNYVLNTTEAKNGTRLAATPSAQNLSTTALFYQQSDGAFVDYDEHQDLSSDMWSNRAYSDLIPPNASVAAFSTARTNDSPNLNTYLLWQDEHNILQMSWSDDNSGWKGPVTFAAFAGANNNTALACLTGLTFPGYPLRAGSALSRCYFQVGGALREVSFDGETWDVVGTVPLF